MPTSPCPFDEDLVACVADIRARGRSWDAAASEVGWDVADLRRAIRREPEYARAYALAKAEIREETEAEMLVTFRGHLRDPDPREALRAAEYMSRHLAGERRDRTRIEVERIRSETALAKANARRASEEPEEPEDERIDMTELTPEQVHDPEYEGQLAGRAINQHATVWLWSGDHRIGETPPDGTDVPLRLIKDDTVRGRQLYWALRVPIQTNFETGPFPAPRRADPPPVLSGEQVAQLEALPKPPPRPDC